VRSTDQSHPACCYISAKCCFLPSCISLLIGGSFLVIGCGPTAHSVSHSVTAEGVEVPARTTSTREPDVEQLFPEGPCRAATICNEDNPSLPYLEVDGTNLCFGFDEDARCDCAAQLGIVLNPELPEGPCRRAVPCDQTGPLFGPFVEVDGRMICFVDGEALCACADEFGVREQTSSCNGWY
jgi:hypothetical protein